MSRWFLAPLFAATIFIAGCSDQPDCKGAAEVCGGTCTNLQTDNANCGACGAACDAGLVCDGGACLVSCQAGHVDCDGTCIDPLTDRGHCGATADCQGPTAGAVCVPGEVCDGGLCQVDCQAGHLDCDGTCIDPLTDRGYCGATADCQGANAGTVCVSGEICDAGTCQPSCSAGLTICGSTCVDTTSDPDHCGGCAAACSVGYACVSSQCEPLLEITAVTFPSTVSMTESGVLGAGGGGRFYIEGQALWQDFDRSTPVRNLQLDFQMSDGTSIYCGVGTVLRWAVMVNGTQVGTYSWAQGSLSGNKTIQQDYHFAPIEPSSGAITLRIEALDTVCPGGGSWNWIAGGSATMH